MQNLKSNLEKIESSSLNFSIGCVSSILKHIPPLLSDIGCENNALFIRKYEKKIKIIFVGILKQRIVIVDIR